MSDEFSEQSDEDTDWPASCRPCVSRVNQAHVSTLVSLTFFKSTTDNEQREQRLQGL